MQKLPWKAFTSYFVAYFVVFAWAPSTRSSGLPTSRHAKRCCSSFFCFLSSGSGGKRWSIPKSKLGKVFFVWIPWYLYLRVRLTALKWFQIVPGKHKMRDVTTVFAYSHLNTPLGQSRHAYYLSYCPRRVLAQGPKPEEAPYDFPCVYIQGQRIFVENVRNVG